MLHLLGQPIQKKHCQAQTTLRRTHGTNLYRLLCTRAFIDISLLYVFYSAFYFKNGFKTSFFEYKTAVRFESRSADCELPKGLVVAFLGTFTARVTWLHHASKVKLTKPFGAGVCVNRLLLPAYVRSTSATYRD
jgi:hypothetical protein